MRFPAASGNSEISRFGKSFSKNVALGVLVKSDMSIRVPLKTALKREKEIAASDTRKADEARLAPG